MNELTIYNVYVEMKSQEQCNRMKQLCVDYNLPHWDYYDAFTLSKIFKEVFSRTIDTKEFFVYTIDKHEIEGKTKVTEEQFINLLKQRKND